jgi:hypothetical protein
MGEDATLIPCVEALVAGAGEAEITLAEGSSDSEDVKLMLWGPKPAGCEEEGVGPAGPLRGIGIGADAV